MYSISIRDTPPECIKDINSLIFRFIWEIKQDKIKRKVMALDYKNGGLRAPSIEVMVKSLKEARNSFVGRAQTGFQFSRETQKFNKTNKQKWRRALFWI